MAEPPRLGVVVPAYSGAREVEACLAALARSADRVDGAVEIVTVLNRPLPGLEAHGRVRLVDPGTNLGFAGGVNRGLAETTAPWVAVVNDDCLVEPETLPALLAAATRDRVGAVAGLMVFADAPGTINVAGIRVDRLGVASERLVGRPVAEARPGPVFGASGGLALYRRDMLEELGGFDETFFAYLEDADLAWRARMSSWEAVLEPAARARHAHSAALGHATARKHFLVGRNRVRMLAKNATNEQLRRHALRMAAYDLAYVAYAAVRHRTLAPLRGRLAGLRDWRRYRAAGAAGRTPVALDRPPGMRAALGRDRAYRADR